jgi:hypothetical protein
VGDVAPVLEIINIQNVLVVNPEWKRLHGWHDCRWKDNIKIYLEKLDGRVGIEFIRFRIRTSSGLFVKGRKFVD